jgi:hypothetical protein
VLTAQVLAGAVTLALCLRLWPLRTVRAELRERLAATGTLDGRLGRVLRLVLG